MILESNTTRSAKRSIKDDFVGLDRVPVMYDSITASKPNFPNVTFLAKDSVSEALRTTGATTHWASRSSESANPRNNRAIEHLLTELNNTESNYPGTTLKLVYHFVGMAPKP